MKNLSRRIVFLSVLLLLIACSSTKVSNRRPIMTEKLPRPATVWIYDFASSPNEIPRNSSLSGYQTSHQKPQSRKQLELGEKLGAEIAVQLVKHVRELGMPARRARRNSKFQVNDIVLRGYLLSVVEGSAAERVVVGFGYGGSELKVAAEGFQVTTNGLRKLGSGASESTGSKTPGGVLGAATLLATHNPAGLIIGTGVKLYGESSGSSTVDGRAEANANEIATVLEERFRQQKWIE